MGVRFTYYGGMCFLVERSDGYKALFDPYFNENKHTEKCASDFYDVDAILVSHHAFDHYGDTEEILRNGHAKVFCCADTCESIYRNVPEIDRGRMIETLYGDTRKLDDMTVHTVRAYHHSKTDYQLDGQKIRVFGPPAGFVVEIEPGVNYYHPGDTALYSDMKLINLLYRPNVMAVGVTGIDPVPNPACEMTLRECAQAVEWIGATVVVPTHYPVGSEKPREFKELMRLLMPEVIVKDGAGVSFMVEPMRVES